MEDFVLQLQGITKEFPGVKALNKMKFDLRRGSIHALIGENGAGKSTFIKTLSGAIRPTSGTIEIDGKSYDYLEPRQAIDLGIAVVYQELIQFEAMSVADNIFMGVADGASGVVLNDQQRQAKAAELLKTFDCDFDPRTLIRELSIANRQIVELTVGEAGIENGVLNAITDADCVVDLAQKQLLESRKQSCGKCVFCREGILQLEAMQKDVTVGKGVLSALDMTREIGEAMTYSTPCSMGQNASRIALSAVEAFRGEYEEHIKKRKCAADVCAAFRKVYIDPLACTGCAKCQSACPTDAIDGAEGYIHIVFDNWCTKCGKCLESCPENAIHLTTGRVPKLPKKMMRPGRFH